MSNNASVPYDGRESMRNATVNPPELDRGIAKQREHTADAVRQYVKEGRRANKPGTTRAIKHMLPAEDIYQQDGSVLKKKEKTVTTRKSH